MKRTSLLAALLCTAASVVGQRVLVVDGLNRPGANFTDLPAAEAAAVDGDIIRLMTDGGAYTAVQTSKALTITASIAQATVRATAAQPMRIVGLGPNRVCALKSLLIVHTGTPGPAVQIQNCLGQVHLDQLEISGGQPALDIALSVVTVKESRILPGATQSPTLVAQGATLSVCGTAIVGSIADSRFQQMAQAAVSLNASTASFAGCNLRGGNGDPVLPPGAGMLVQASSVEIGSAGATGVVSAGTSHGFGSVPAIAGQSSLVRVTPTVQLIAAGGAPSTTGVTRMTASFPMLDGYGTSWLNFYHESIPGAAEVTLYGFSGRPLASTAFAGLWWLDPQMYVAQVGVPTGIYGPFPYGMTLVVQLANVDATGIVLSNPVAFTAR